MPPRPASATLMRKATMPGSKDSSPSMPFGGTARSCSSGMSRWTHDEDRLSIRKMPAFPIQQTAPKPFLASCADITPTGRNWNAEFQLAWESDDGSYENAMQRKELLYRIEAEFEKEAIYFVEQIVRLDDDGPRELPKFVQCFRVKNIFFRVLPDSQSGRNYISSLRGILQSGSKLVSVPLSVMFFYRGMPVLAQALVPMPKQPVRLFGANSNNDPEVAAELIFIAEALNIPFPDETMEVYEGLDGRCYVTNSNATLTPLFTNDTIMKRQEMLRLCPHVTEGPSNTLTVLDAPSVQDALMELATSTRKITQKLSLLCEALHHYGVNLCLLKQVYARASGSARYSSSQLQSLLSLLAVEMISRTVKQEFYTEVQGKRIAYDDVLLTKTLSKHLGAAFVDERTFQINFLERLARKYGLVDEDDTWILFLTSQRMSWKMSVVERVSALLGATITRSGSQTSVTWRTLRAGGVIPRLVDPKQATQLAVTYQHVRVEDSHWYTFCMPLCWKVACWQNCFEDALRLVRLTAEVNRNREGVEEIIYWLFQMWVCKVCFRTRSKKHVAEGRQLFATVRKAFDRLSCPKSQGRLRIEYAFSLLDVCTTLMNDPSQLRSCVEEAVVHFYAAISLLPSYLKSEHGAWLHLQPYIGLLQCKKLLASCSVDTDKLVRDSIQLSNIGWASDFFIQYLWELGLQLEHEGQFEYAIQVLTTAINLSKKKPTLALDLPTLLMDTAHVFRSWDLFKYAAQCMQLCDEAAAYAVQYHGPESKVHAVVVNNRGAIEIELNLLEAAAKTLANAGRIFHAAAVPADDPDYIAYLQNVEALRERLKGGGQKARRLVGITRRYPFLDYGCEHIPWADIKPLEDETFVGLARERSRQEAGTRQALELEREMKVRVGELFRTLESGAHTLRLYPFLPATLNGVYIESLNLQDDIFFSDITQKMSEASDPKEARRLEREAILFIDHLTRLVAKERAEVAAGEEEFMDEFSGVVNFMIPVPFEYAAEDEVMGQLIKKRRSLRRSSKRASSHEEGMQIQEVNEELETRLEGLDAEAASWRASLAPWLVGSMRFNLPSSDFSRDYYLRDLLQAYHRALESGDQSQFAESLNYKIGALCLGIWVRNRAMRRARRVEKQELRQHVPYVTDESKRTALMEDVLAPWCACVYVALPHMSEKAVLQRAQKACRKREDATELTKWYFSIDEINIADVVLEDLPHTKDDFYLQWSLQREAELLKTNGKVNKQVRFCSHKMHMRLLQLNSLMRKAKSSAYVERQQMESRLPFLQSRYCGIHIFDIAPLRDAVFRHLYEKHKALLLEDNVSQSALDELTHRMRLRAAEIAERMLKTENSLQSRYAPFSGKMESVLLSQLELEYTPHILAKEEQWKQLAGSASMQTRGRRLVHEIQRYIEHMSGEIFIERFRRLVESRDLHERYAYLAEEPVEGVQLTSPGLALPYDSEFRNQTNTLEVSRETEGLLTPKEALAAEAAINAHVSTLAIRHAAVAGTLQREFSDIPSTVLGVPISVLHIEDDKLLSEFLSSPSTTYREKIEKLVELIIDRRIQQSYRDDLNEEILSTEPGLIYTSRRCVALRHLPLDEDEVYTSLRDAHLRLLTKSGPGSEAISVSHCKLWRRADELAMLVLTQWHSIIQLLRGYPYTLDDDTLHYLRLHPHLLDDLKYDSRGFLTPECSDQLAKRISEEMNREMQNFREQEQFREDLPHLPRVLTEQLLHDPNFDKLRKKRENLIDAGDESNLERVENDMLVYAQRILANEKPPSPSPMPSPFPPTAVQLGGSESPSPLLTSRHHAATPSPTKADPLPHNFVEPHDEVPGWLDTIDADEILRNIVAQYLQAQKDPEKNASMLRELLAAMNARSDTIAAALLAEAQERELRDKYGFLHWHGDVPGWIAALFDDDQFFDMMALHDELMKDPVKNAAALRELEVAMNARSDAIADALRAQAQEQELRDKYGFLHWHGDVPGWATALFADADFRDMMALHDELMKDPVKNAVALRELEVAMNARSDAIADALRAQAQEQELRDKYGFLHWHGDVPGWATALFADADFRDMMALHDELMKDPVKNAAALRELEVAMNARSDAIADALRAQAQEQELRDKYGFLHWHGDVPGWATALFADADFRDMMALHDELMKDPVKNAAALRELEVAMNARSDAIADALRAQAQEQELRDKYGFLHWHGDVPGWATALFADADFRDMMALHDELMKDPVKNAVALRELEVAMNARSDAIADALRAQAQEQELRDKYGFLHWHGDVPGWATALFADADFRDMMALHDELMKDPVKNAAALRELEVAMNARSDAIADALRAQAQEQELRDKYGFLHWHGDVPGWATALFADADFRDMMALHDELMKDPVKNAAALRELEVAMNARSDAIADALRAQAQEQELRDKYGFLHWHGDVPGWATALFADADFRDMMALHDELMKDPVKNAVALRELEVAMNARSDAIADALRAQAQEQELRDKYGFLHWHGDVPGWATALFADADFRDMMALHDELMKDPVKNAAALRELEVAMNARSDAIADALRAQAQEQELRDKYGFLHWHGDVPGWATALFADADFRDMMALHDELMKDPVKNAAALRELEVAMNARSDAIADALRAQAQEQELRDKYGFLHWHGDVPGWATALFADADFRDMMALHDELMKDPVKNAVALRELEVAMNARSDAIADALRAQAQEQELRDKYGFLHWHGDVPGWLQTVVNDSDFNELRGLYDEVVKDRLGNSELVVELENAMNICVDRIADTLMEEANLGEDDQYRSLSGLLNAEDVYRSYIEQEEEEDLIEMSGAHVDGVDTKRAVEENNYEEDIFVDASDDSQDEQHAQVLRLQQEIEDLITAELAERQSIDDESNIAFTLVGEELERDHALSMRTLQSRITHELTAELQAEEETKRHIIQEEHEHASESLCEEYTNSRDDALQRLQERNLQEGLAALAAAEEAERRAIEEESAADGDLVAAQGAASHDDALQRLKERNLQEGLAALAAAEEAERRAIEEESAADGDLVAAQGAASHDDALQRLKERNLQEGLAALAAAEEAERRAIEEESAADGDLVAAQGAASHDDALQRLQERSLQEGLAALAAAEEAERRAIEEESAADGDLVAAQGAASHDDALQRLQERNLQEGLAALVAAEEAERRAIEEESAADGDLVAAQGAASHDDALQRLKERSLQEGLAALAAAEEAERRAIEEESAADGDLVAAQGAASHDDALQRLKERSLQEGLAALAAAEEAERRAIEEESAADGDLVAAQGAASHDDALQRLKERNLQEGLAALVAAEEAERRAIEEESAADGDLVAAQGAASHDDALQRLQERNLQEGLAALVAAEEAERRAIEEESAADGDLVAAQGAASHDDALQRLQERSLQEGLAALAAAEEAERRAIEEESAADGDLVAAQGAASHDDALQRLQERNLQEGLAALVAAEEAERRAIEEESAADGDLVAAQGAASHDDALQRLKERNLQEGLAALAAAEEAERRAIEEESAADGDLVAAQGAASHDDALQRLKERNLQEGLAALVAAEEAERRAIEEESAADGDLVAAQGAASHDDALQRLQERSLQEGLAALAAAEEAERRAIEEESAADGDLVAAQGAASHDDALQRLKERNLQEGLAALVAAEEAERRAIEEESAADGDLVAAQGAASHDDALQRLKERSLQEGLAALAAAEEAERRAIEEESAADGDLVAAQGAASHDDALQRLKERSLQEGLAALAAAEEAERRAIEEESAADGDLVAAQGAASHDDALQRLKERNLQEGLAALAAAEEAERRAIEEESAADGDLVAAQGAASHDDALQRLKERSLQEGLAALVAAEEAERRAIEEESAADGDLVAAQGAASHDDALQRLKERNLQEGLAALVAAEEAERRAIEEESAADGDLVAAQGAASHDDALQRLQERNLQEGLAALVAAEEAERRAIEEESAADGDLVAAQGAASHDDALQRLQERSLQGGLAALAAAEEAERRAIEEESAADGDLVAAQGAASHDDALQRLQERNLQEGLAALVAAEEAERRAIEEESAADGDLVAAQGAASHDDALQRLQERNLQEGLAALVAAEEAERRAIEEESAADGDLVAAQGAASHDDALQRLKERNLQEGLAALAAAEEAERRAIEEESAADGDLVAAQGAASHDDALQRLQERNLQEGLAALVAAEEAERRAIEEESAADGDLVAAQGAASHDDALQRLKERNLQEGLAALAAAEEAERRAIEEESAADGDLVAAQGAASHDDALQRLQERSLQEGLAALAAAEEAERRAIEEESAADGDLVAAQGAASHDDALQRLKERNLQEGLAALAAAEEAERRAIEEESAADGDLVAAQGAASHDDALQRLQERSLQEGLAALAAAEEAERRAIEEESAADGDLVAAQGAASHDDALQRLQERSLQEGLAALAAAEEAERRAIEEESAADGDLVAAQGAASHDDALQRLQERSLQEGLAALAAAEEAERRAIEEESAADGDLVAAQGAASHDDALQRLKERNLQEGLAALVAAEEAERRAIEEESAADGDLVAAQGAASHDDALQRLQERNLQEGLAALVAAEEAERRAIEEESAADGDLVAAQGAASHDDALQRLQERNLQEGLAALVAAEEAERRAIEEESAADGDLVAAQGAASHDDALQRLKERNLQEGLAALVAAEEAERRAIEEESAADGDLVAAQGAASHDDALQRLKERNLQEGLAALAAAEEAERRAIEEESAADGDLVAAQGAASHDDALQRLKERNLQEGLAALAAAEEAERRAIEEESAADGDLVAAQGAASHDDALQRLKERNLQEGLAALAAAEEAERRAIEEESAADGDLVAAQGAASHDDALQRLKERSLQEGLAALAAAEEAERRAIEEESAADGDLVAAQGAASHDDALQRLQERNLQEGLAALVAAEEAERRAIEEESAADGDLVAAQGAASHDDALQRLKERNLQEGLAALVAAEEAERRDIESESDTAFNLTNEERERDHALAVRKMQSRVLRDRLAELEAEEEGARCVLEEEYGCATEDLIQESARSRENAVVRLRKRSLQEGLAALAAAEEAERRAIEEESAADGDLVAAQGAASHDDALQRLQERNLQEGLAALVAAEEAERRDIESESDTAFNLTNEERERDHALAVRKMQSRVLRDRLAELEAEEEGARCVLEEEYGCATEDLIQESARSRENAVVRLRKRSLQEGLAALAAAEEAERRAIEEESAADGDLVAAQGAASHDDALQRLQERNLQEGLAALVAAEEAERRDIESESDTAFNLTNEERERDHALAVRKMQSRVLRERLAELEAEEEVARGVLWGELAGAMSSLLAVESVEKECALRRQRDRAGAAAIALLEKDESKARGIISEDCNSAFNAIRRSAKKRLSVSVRKLESRKVTEVFIPKEEAASQLQRVGRGFLCRLKFGTRLFNRKRQAFVNDLNRLFLDEFNGRIAIAEAFLNGLADMEKLATATSYANFESDPLHLLAKEEELKRAEIAEDFDYGMERIKRGEEKVQNQILSGYPSRKSEKPDAVGTMPLKPFSPPVAVLDPRSPNERNQYRGFELDEIGRFLLSYERDLLQLKQSILSKRQRTAMEHDRLKEIRDKACQDIQRSGSGATWVPSRPLPLSDLVRGPSVQYKK